MGLLKIAAVQATYVLMNRDATIDRVEELTAEAAQEGAQLVVFPEAFVPGTPIWIDTRPIWDGDDEWFGMLSDNAVVIPGPAADRLAAIAEKYGVWLVVGVQEREPTGSTIYNTVLYFSPQGRLVDRHRKLVPTGSERTVWGMGDGSTLRVVDTSARPHRWPDLLGELHAPCPVPPLRARGGRLAGARRSPRATVGSPRCSTWRGRTGCSSSG